MKEEYPPLLKLFSLYNIFVEHKMEKGNELMKEYNKISLQDMQEHKVIGSQATYLRYSVVCLVGADRKNFGKIISCSINSAKYLGATCTELLGKNFHVLFPTSLAKVYYQKMQEKLANSQDQLFTFE